MDELDIDAEGWDKLAWRLTEHFGSFCLVGYTLEGERVRLRHAPTSKDWDALQQMMEDTVIRECAVSPRVVLEDG